ncbi:MAG: heavy metal translocating P-type ATPase metal-binding domain-containing protein [Ferruginibacter sp.]
MRVPVKETLVCFHCGEDCGGSKIKLEEKKFCCEGCKMVYEILNQHELCSYYDLNKNPGQAQKIQVRTDKFSFLDDGNIIKKLIQFTDGKQTNVILYLPQMHCSSCLWLLESAGKLNPGIISSRVNFAKKEVFIVFENAATSLRKVVETLASVGYEPYLSLHDIEKGKTKLWDRSRAYKIGIAGFCFSNIMMMSFPEYFSIGGFLEEEIGAALKYFIVFLSLPVLFYCAAEFFIAAWQGLKKRFLNIDAPIALAIAITFGRSLYEIITGTGTGYLDSMSGIVFFMLTGRLLQDKTYRSFSFERDFKSFFPIAVTVVKNGSTIPVAVNEVKVNDVILVYSNELVPVDGILSKGEALIDYSFVSGESAPVQKRVGEIIYAGGRQLSGKIELVVIKEISQSYLTALWNKSVFKQKKESRRSFIHTLSTVFTFIVLTVGLIAGLYWYMHSKPTLMWNALSTVLIVACPCALLLSATFTNGNILRILGKNELYLRHPDVIEDLANTDHIVFDKTGTLTENSKMNVTYKGRLLSGYEEALVCFLMQQSSHPLSMSIANYLKLKWDNNFQDQLPEIKTTNFKLVEGRGIEAWAENQHIKIGSADFTGSEKDNIAAGVVYVKIDDAIPGKFIVENKYRPGFLNLINSLKEKYSLSILSGDNDGEKKYLKSIIGNSNNTLFNQLPRQKLEYIQNLQTQYGKNVLMIGDGLNDAGALRKSDVGIAISESGNNFTPASDGILSAAGFSKIDALLSYAKSGKKIILISFILSVLYNITGLYFAVQGTLSPLIAAILMPASSVSIILITYGLSEFIAWQKGLR